jgi:hypothetical protein
MIAIATPQVKADLFVAQRDVFHAAEALQIERVVLGLMVGNHDCGVAGQSSAQVIWLRQHRPVCRAPAGGRAVSLRTEAGAGGG